MNTEVSYLSLLPPEIWQLIIKKVSYEQMLNIRKVSKEFKNLVEGTSKFKNSSLSVDIMNFNEVLDFGFKTKLNMKKIKITEKNPIFNGEPFIMVNLCCSEYEKIFGKEELRQLKENIATTETYTIKDKLFQKAKNSMIKQLKNYKESQMEILIKRISNVAEEVTIEGQEVSYSRRDMIAAIGEVKPSILAKELNNFRTLTLQSANMKAEQYLELLKQIGSGTQIKKLSMSGRNIRNFQDPTLGVTYTYFNIFKIFPLETLCQAFLNIERVEIYQTARSDLYLVSFDKVLRDTVKTKQKFSLKLLSFHIDLDNSQFTVAPVATQNMTKQKYFNEPVQSIKRRIHINLMNCSSAPDPPKLYYQLSLKDIESICCAPSCTAFKIPWEILYWTAKENSSRNLQPNSVEDVEDDLLITCHKFPVIRKRIINNNAIIY